MHSSSVLQTQLLKPLVEQAPTERALHHQSQSDQISCACHASPHHLHWPGCDGSAEGRNLRTGDVAQGTQTCHAAPVQIQGCSMHGIQKPSLANCQCGSWFMRTHCDITNLSAPSAAAMAQSAAANSEFETADTHGLPCFT